MAWKELYDKLLASSDLKTLFFNSKRIDDTDEYGLDSYLKSLFYDQFARRLPRERSLENLGLVNIVYTMLETVKYPKIAMDLSISEFEWKCLLKISADYILRNGFYYYIPKDIKTYLTSRIKNFSIYPSNSKVSNVKRFPKFDRKLKRQNRLCLLICAGLGLTNNELIDDCKEDKLMNCLIVFGMH